MALSSRTKSIVEVALADRRAASELNSAIDSGSNPQAAAVALLGATSNLVGVDGTGSNAAPLAGTEARLDAIEAKVDALITALKNAGLMAT
jgi:hypothetical protein